jgi:hypothetical protein
MTLAAILTQSGELAAAIAKVRSDLDRRLAIYYALDHISSAADGEAQCAIVNAAADLKAGLIESADDILESGDERLVESMQRIEGFQVACRWRQEKIAKDGVRARAAKQRESYLLRRQVA